MGSKSGVQTFEEDGVSIRAEIGGHVLTQRANLAAKVGEVASMWAHLEAQLGGYMAVLLETTPERAFALLEQYRSANATAEAAKSLGKVTLTGKERDEFLGALTKFKELATRRNHVLHAVWAWKAKDPEALYRITATQFSVLMLELVAADPSKIADELHDRFDERYDETRLQSLIDDIQSLLLSLTQQALGRLRKIIEHSAPQG